jgi:DNA uptake protein ComE-like DNA-binding protein
LRDAAARTGCAIVLLAVATIASAQPPSTVPSPLAARNRPAIVEHYVDLNGASRNELMTLPGIGAREAAQIVANRPYLTKTELVSKNVLPVGPFLSLRHLVVAMPPAIAKGRS